MIGSQYLYNGFYLNDTLHKYHLTGVEGLDSPGIRETRENKAAAHGQNDYGTYLAERLITFKGTILADSYLERNQLRQDLLDGFVPDGTFGWLKWNDGINSYQVYCKVLSRDIDDNYKDDSFNRDFLINLVAVDPCIYSQTENIDTIYIPSATGGRGYVKTYAKAYGTISVGGKATLNNLGNFDSLPTVKLYGPLTTPKIRNNSDSAKEIQIDTTVSAGDYLEVDFADHTIMLNGTTSRYNFLNSNSDWWVIKPGNNDIEFRDSGGNVLGYALINWRSAWI
jgi:hypothetical protein